MSKIPPEVVDQIKLAADITEVVGGFVNLKRRGQNLWAPCPFHDEKTASFSVAPNKGFFKCFGCQKSGSVVDFVMEIEKVSYPEALRWLAKRYGIGIPETDAPKSDEEKARQDERDSLFILTDWAKEFFKRQLAESDEGKGIGGAYLRERGIQRPAQDAFELGYSLDQWDALLLAAQRAGYDQKYLEPTGLVVVKEEAPDRRYDRFRGRVMFPIHNASGRVVGFGARTLRRDDKAGAKYLNSPESAIYHKGDVLYGLYQAREAVRKEDVVYLVEGYLDVISLWQGGVRNVAAISGTALTENQVRLLARYTKNVTLLLDGDAAGLRASQKGVDLLLAGGLNVRVCPLPAGEDPDSFIQKQGDTAFRAHLAAHTQDFITFKARAWQAQAVQDPTLKAGAIRDVLASIARVQDEIKRSVFIQETSRLFGMPEDVLLGAYNKIARELSRPTGPASGGQRPPAAPGQTSGQASGPRPDRPENLPPEAYGISPEEQGLQVGPDGELELVAAPAYERLEREVIRLIISYADHTVRAPDNQPWLLAPYILALLESNGTTFRDVLCAQVAREMRAAIDQGALPEIAHFRDHPAATIRTFTIDRLAETDRWGLSEHWASKFHIEVPDEPAVLQAAADQAVYRMSFCLLEDKITELAAQLPRAVEFDEQLYLMTEIQQLTRIKNQLGELLGRVIV
ncbi:MAG: DNA primase [Hymenobacteraceae bacterium]|nr:DNA primase [Hymenobacteraceae bacterium]